MTEDKETLEERLNRINGRKDRRRDEGYYKKKGWKAGDSK